MKIGVKNSLDLLSDIVLISNSTLNLDKRLNTILNKIFTSFSLHGIALYALHSEKSEIVLKAEKGCSFSKTIQMSEEALQLCIQDKQPIIFYETSKDYEFFFEVPDKMTTANGGLFPIFDDKYYYGLVVIALEEYVLFDDEDLILLKTITHEIAGTMRNAQLYSNAKDTVENLLVLNETWKELNSTLDLDRLLEITVLRICRCLKAKSGIVVVGKDEKDIVHNNLESCSEKNLLNISKVLFIETRAKEELIIPTPEQLVELASPTSTVMALPLIHHGNYIGSVALFGKEDGTLFQEKDQELFSTIASQISAVIDHALLIDESKLISNEKELMVKELTMLFELNKVVMTTIDLDRLLHIILTAVTIGDGFGFNRAMLFLFNEATGSIQGMMGVGPDSREEAGEVWSDIYQDHKTLQDFVVKNQLELPQSKLNETIKAQRISIDDMSILGLTVIEKRPFNIKCVSNDSRVNEGLMSQLNCHAFATVPLLASGKVIGVIMVDNIFNGRPINDEDVRLLTLFANQAGMAIDNSILYKDLEKAHHKLKEAHSKLVHTEKLAALGEMAAGVAHEIRNPLVSIGGFARRLSRKLEGDENRNYVNVICQEVERLELILNDILVFSREEPLERDCHDINAIIKDTLQFFLGEFTSCDIHLDTNLASDLDKVDANLHQLKQVFINLFSNAKHEMEKGGTLKVKSFKTDVASSSFTTVEISDTGSGIPCNIMSNIFNPFFTTKTTGTGLGLAITHKILSTYGGEIEVFNNETGGATFVIKLPGKKVIPK